MIELSENAKEIFRKLYSFKDESIEDTFKRVAKEFATNEKEEEMAYNLLENNIWRPNTPVFLNAGTKHKVFSACFPKGTLIRTKDGLQTIEDINEEDEVLTHNCRYKKTINTINRYYNGYLYKLKVNGIPNGLLTSTNEHPYYVIDNKNLICKRRKSCRCIPNEHNKYCYKMNENYKKDCDMLNVYPKFVWKKAEDIEKGDYVTISYDKSIENVDFIDICDYIDTSKYNITEDSVYYQSNHKANRYIPIDKDTMLFFGYYLAEGSCGRKGGDIRITFSLYKDNEIEYCEDVKRILEEKFGLQDVKIIENENTGTRIVRKSNIVMGNFLRNFFGDSSLNKKIHRKIMKVDELLQRQLLVGIFRGDGCISRNTVSISLANFELIHQLWEMLMRCDMFFPMNFQYQSKNTTWNHTQAYRLSTPAHYVKDFVKEIWPLEPCNNFTGTPQRKYFKLGGYWALRVYDIEKSKYDGVVYNLEVDDDNTYNIMNVNVHNCYTVGLEDSMDSIYDIANVARKIFQYGSGVGIPIGNLREKEAYIYEGEYDKPPEGKSSGPICFMKLYDAVGETTKSGGRVRRAAILCSMPVWHPDIIEFINCKEEDGRLSNMNISVTITDKFMKALEDGIPFGLYSPSDGRRVGEINAKDLWDRLAYMNWKSADPGILFIDTINKYNPLKRDILINVSNPCGEQPLIPFGCCNLSAINISKFVSDGLMNWDSLYETSKQVILLMDNAIDNMEYPDERFRDTSQKYRQVGIGPMGLSDAMFDLNIKYDSLKGKEFAGRVMKTLTSGALDGSAKLARERGCFYNYDRYRDDVLDIVKTFTDGDENLMLNISEYGLRHSAVTTAAPTGTTAISCDASYGIEPCFGLVFQKNLIDGSKMMFVNPIFKKKFENEEWYTDDLIDKIFFNGGSLKGLRGGIPREVRDVFVVAHDIKPKDRIDVQSSIQQYCSSAISSTINLPQDSTKDEISELYRYAYEKGLKGVTVYRDGCKQNQPVTFKPSETNTPTEFIRPTRLSADVFRIETGNGTLYVTVGSSGNKPIELFMQIGKSGQILNTLSEALGRVVSIALQGGVPINNIIKTLLGINSDRPTWSRLDESDPKPVQILSIPDGLAQLLNRYYADGKYNGFNVDVEKCPKCGSPVMMIEGCASCICGWSRCG